MCLLYNSRQSGQVLTGRQKLVGLFEGSVQPPGALATAPPGFENVIHPKVGATSLLASLGTPPQSGCFRIRVSCLVVSPGALATAPPGFENVIHPKVGATSLLASLGTPPQSGCFRIRVSCLVLVSWCRLFARAVSTLLGAPNQPNQRQTRVSCLARVVSRLRFCLASSRVGAARTFRGACLVLGSPNQGVLSRGLLVTGAAEPPYSPHFQPQKWHNCCNRTALGAICRNSWLL
jgi:hypothetical protein